MIDFTDTICAPATVSGTGAIAIIRISGDKAFKAAGELVRLRHGMLSDAPQACLRFCTFADGDNALDEGLVAVFRAPKSYTGEDSVEFYFHASAYIAGRMLELLEQAGCRLARPGEFTQRAYLNGKMDLSQAEAVADVIGSTTAVEHRVAIKQMKGGYSAELRKLRDKLLELSALLELELDFSEEEVEFADRGRLRELTGRACSHCTRLADSFRLGNALKNGVPVAIVGAPNSGKSTLLNALVGEERAIVTDIPGTTRDTVEESCVMDGVRFRFIDTAGMRESDDVVERLGIERAYSEMGKADIVIGVVDGRGENAAAEASALLARVREGQAFILAVNKCDLAPAAGAVPEGASGVDGAVPEAWAGSAVQFPAVKEGFSDFVTQFSAVPEGGADSAAPVRVSTGSAGSVRVVRISAKTGLGLDELRTAVTSCIAAHGDGDTLVTNARHASALRSASSSLSQVLCGLDSGLPGDLLAEDLRAAISSLSDILGESITVDDILGEIFGKFCIGK